MRRGSALIEHLAALAVLSLVAVWLLVLQNQYQKQVLPQREAVLARYAAHTALAQDPAPNVPVRVKVGSTTLVVVARVNRVEVQANGKIIYTYPAP